MDFEATSARIVPSITDLAATALAEARDDEHALATFSDLIAREQIPLPPTMGLRDYLRRVLRLAGARLKVRELEPQPASLTWLRIHVPRNCSAIVGVEGSESGTRQLEISALGSGLGSQVVVTLTTKMQSGPRTACADYELAFHVQPTEYLVDGRASIELSVIGFDGHRSLTRESCRLCDTAERRSSPAGFVAGPFVDMVNDSVPSTVTREYELLSTRSGNVGIDVPGINTRLALKLVVSRRSKVSLAYTLQPGHRYTPYKLIDGDSSILLATDCWQVD